MDGGPPGDVGSRCTARIETRTDLARAFGEHTDDDPVADKWRGVATESVDDRSGRRSCRRAAAWFAGPIVDRFDVGDHVALVVEPDRVEARRDELDDSDQFGFQQTRGLRARPPGLRDPPVSGPTSQEGPVRSGG